MPSTIANQDAAEHADIPQSDSLEAIISLARRRDDLAAVWLYGSRARGDHHPESDFDLAVAYTSWISDPLERRLRPELLAQEWQRELGLKEAMMSVVDLAIAPIPLGWSILIDVLPSLSCLGSCRQRRKGRGFLRRSGAALSHS